MRISHKKAPNLENNPSFTRARFSFSLRITILICIGYFKPSKSKNITNLITEPDSQMLGAGLEISSLKVVSHRFMRRLAEQRHHPSGNESKK
jgi:hypothetical protein